MRLAFISLLAACALAGVLPGWAAGPPNAADLEAELVCPVCETTLDQSNAPVAERMKAFIRQRIAAGETEDQIKDELVDQFGAGVLATPPKSGFGLLAWLIPLTALFGGAIAVGLAIRAWSHRRESPVAAQPLDPDLERRVDEELARFESR